MFARRIQQIKPFRVMEVLERAAQIEASGARVVHFEVGEPDFPTAAPIVDAAQQALADGRTKYTAATGIPQLREVISQFYHRKGLQVDPRRVVVTSGASAGLTLLSALLIDEHDEVLITDPGYPCNEVFIRLTGGVPRTMSVNADAGFQPRCGDIEGAWRDRTRGVLLASPANPTGTMLDAEELQRIADTVRQRQGFFILDEIYQGLNHRSGYSSGLALVDDLYVLNSFSKFFGMTGWRLGWLVVPEEAEPALTKLAQNLFISPGTVAQYAALAAFEPEALAIHEARAEIFQQRARRLQTGLQNLGFRLPVPPDGAFYLYVDVSHTGMGSGEFCMRLLNDYHVAVTPGEDFGVHQHERFVRFAFTTGDESIDLGLTRIASALRDWDVG